MTDSTAAAKNEQTTVEYEFHETANLFPLLEGDDFDELVTSIKAHGQRDCIELLDGKIIDGRNRYRACIEAGIDPEFFEDEPDIDDPVQFVLDKNLHRRHLTTGQRAAIAADVAKLYEKEAKERQRQGGGDKKSDRVILPQPIKNRGKATDKAAAKLNVSGKSTRDAKVVIESGDKKLEAEMRAGKKAPSKAANEVREKQGKRAPSSSKPEVVRIVERTISAVNRQREELLDRPIEEWAKAWKHYTTVMRSFPETLDKIITSFEATKKTPPPKSGDRKLSAKKTAVPKKRATKKVSPKKRTTKKKSAKKTTARKPR